MSWSTTCFFLASSMWVWSPKLPLLASPCMLTGCVTKPSVVSAHCQVWIQLQAERLFNPHLLACRQVLQGDMMIMPMLPYG